MATPRTLLDKIWDSHLVDRQEDGTCLLYIDRHIIHEVTSPQPFEGLRLAGRKMRRPELTLAVIDHNIATDRDEEIPEDSQLQIDTLRRNCADFGVELFEVDDPRNGIVHIIGPEQGFTLPGVTLVCGDSHTATHGAFGALAFGIGAAPPTEPTHVRGALRLDLVLPHSPARKAAVANTAGAVCGGGVQCGVHCVRPEALQVGQH